MAKLGYEVEGKMKGIYTLFVEVDEIPRLLNYQNKHLLEKVSHVSVPDYQSKFTKDHLDILMSLDNRIVLTLETPKPSVSILEMPSRLNLVLVIEKPEFFDMTITDQIKFVNDAKMVYMVPKESMFLTTPEEFDSDIEVKIV